MTSAWFAGCGSLEEIRKRYHELAMQYHPDRGGSNSIMAEINAAYDIACKLAGTSSRQNTYHRAYQEPEGLSVVLRKLIERLVGMNGLTVELCGTWIWVSGATWIWKEQLSDMGFRWASKKKMWYFAGTPKSSSRRYSMSQIREMHGSRVFRNAYENDEENRRNLP